MLNLEQIIQIVQTDLFPQKINRKIFKNLKVMFLTSGCWNPYPVLENGIEEAFREVVKELFVVNPTDNIVQHAQNSKPDLFLVFHGFCNPIPKSTIEAIRDMGIKTVIWFTDDPYYTDLTKTLAPWYEHVFTQEINCISYYHDIGCNSVHYVPLAVNEKIFFPKSVELQYQTDILFVGVAFDNRIRLFDSIAQYLLKKNVRIIGPWWERMHNYYLLKDKIELVWKSPEETANYYRGAKIVINLHREHNDSANNQNSKNINAISINPRTLEVAACGAFQLTDERPGLSCFYTVGKDIDIYHSSEELVQKIDYYLTHEHIRETLAKNALVKTTKENTFKNRVEQLLQVLYRN